MHILKPGVLYFALVFSAGFLLGTIRTVWIAPRIGARAAELMEAPLMLAFSYVAARWVVRRLSMPLILSRRLWMGCVALALMLLAEFALVVPLRGMSLMQYLATRDPISGAAYYIALGLFAIMPMLVAPRR